MTYKTLPPRLMEDRRWTVEVVREGRIKEVLGQVFLTKEKAWNFYLELVNSSESESRYLGEDQTSQQAEEDPSRGKQQHSTVCIQ